MDSLPTTAISAPIEAAAIPVPGSIVRCRNRDWVLLPGDDHLIRLRPLTGTTDEVIVLHKGLTQAVGYELAGERPVPSRFPPPTPDDLGDAAASHLLWQAARLTLREGATPFRSLGRISIKPRMYQFVPLLMALRLDPVRLFIADDVGIGKTIEAGLIAREFFDRGEIRRMAVLCPPSLCDQWRQELLNKFHLDAVVVRSGTIGSLERRKLGPESIYRHYPIQVVSIDFVKSDRNRHSFLQNCPEFVIVDEVHGASAASEDNRGQQQRHRLLQDLAADPERHLLLLTATPHSGIGTAFSSLLTLLRPEFGQWDAADLNEEQRAVLARHFVQRTRRDIERDWEGEHCFPERLFIDRPYRLSDAYRQLYERTFAFCSEIVRQGEDLELRKRRVRYWGALALLRCVMSSPASAIAAIENRRGKPASIEDEIDFQNLVFESPQMDFLDETPSLPVEQAEETLGDSDRRRLRELAHLARNIAALGQDTKCSDCVDLVLQLLQKGANPIVWCRYIATAEYLAKVFAQTITPRNHSVRIVCVTGRMGEEERRALIDGIDPERPRVLVATDCLSEGINLQDKFNAAIHYDLPWNPNRLEQREGRVDRYGQPSPVVHAIRCFSPDNPVDGVVLEVLLNKAREIRRTLGTHVPVPEESDSVTEALLKALFLKGDRRQAKRRESTQITLDALLPDSEAEKPYETLHRHWDQNVEREKINRTRFAQRAIKPENVREELAAADAVLGNADAVREFVLTAAQRLNLSIQPDKRPDVFRVVMDRAAFPSIPNAVRQVLPLEKTGVWRVSFLSPTPEGAEYVGRNHPVVAAMARYLMEDALGGKGKAVAARCGVIRTRSVAVLTTLFLLRVRYRIEQPAAAELLSEEVWVCGHIGAADRGSIQWLTDDEAFRLLAEARPDANVPMSEKRELVSQVLADWPRLEPLLTPRLAVRAKTLEQAHKRIRKAVRLQIRDFAVKPLLPPDVIGLLVLQPEVNR